MNNFKAAILEDELPAARLLYTILKRLRPQWELLLLPGNIEEAVIWFQNNPHPDLLFLDIHLSDGNSFDFLSLARPTSMLIFTTAYDQYALQAFRVNSIDYLLKPINEPRLLEAISKYESILGNPLIAQNNHLNLILESLQHPEKRYRTRFLIYGNDKSYTLEVADIAYFYSENKITFAVTFSGQEHILDLSLNKLSEQLDPDQFFRANRQFLLSIRSISHIEPYFNGKIVVFIKPCPKCQITISEEKISQFKKWLNY